MSAILPIAVSDRLVLSQVNFCQTLAHVLPARVILSVPHDGLIASDFGFFGLRDKGVNGRRAVHGRDKHVWPLVRDIVETTSAAGAGADAVRFLVPRIYIDGNRALRGRLNPDADTAHQTALDDDRLTPLYKNYFGVIEELVTRAIATHGPENVFFIDCHGFGKQPDIAPKEGFDLILGTANRATIRHSDIDRLFAAAMRANGYTVFLPDSRPVRPQGDPFSAGYTTIHTAEMFGIDCMQIEVASHFRGRDDTAKGQKLARDISNFLIRQYCAG